jgi:hypothetical protein
MYDSTLQNGALLLLSDAVVMCLLAVKSGLSDIDSCCDQAVIIVRRGMPREQNKEISSARFIAAIAVIY